ncbi:MAG TPA: TCR/Tet family MFS transporter [Alphaproteobacteria bacterium]|nr:TCR/Tet family MFS transporter [Alphaproteobacteria bacterium]
MVAADQPQPGRAAFGFIFVTLLLDMMALGLVVPVLPKLIIAFEGNDVGEAAHMGGYFGFAWALMQFVSMPILGSLADRYGRRPVIILSNLGLGLDYVLMALAPNLWFLFVGRIISGITSASYTTAMAYVADVTPPERRAARFGLMGAAFGLGFTAGPAIGGFLSDIGLRLPFWAAAGFSLANAAYGFFVLPESLRLDRRAPFKWHQANPLGALKLLRSDPLLGRLATAGFLQRFAHVSLPGMFVYYATYRYGWDGKTMGSALMVVGIAQMIVSAVLVRYAIAHFGERGTLLIGLVCGITGFIGFALAPNGLVFLASIPFVSLWGLANPAIQGLATRLIGPSAQGRLQGAQSSLNSFADMIGPIVFTQIFAAAIATGAAIRVPGAPYFLAALLVVIALGVCVGVQRPVSAPAE